MPDDVIDRIAAELTRLQKIRDRTQALTRDRIDPASFASLFRLICDGPMRSGALADALHADASTVSRQVAQLVERGLVERLADPTDGRASVLAATERGRVIAEQIRRRRHENLSKVLASWPDADRATFATMLNRFVDDFERNRPDMLAILKSTGTEGIS